ncbi:MAG: efflux RND transporter periplasmic adaptor subunit [Candidatus Neomarinimicrobiota bacterium]|jgi:HlyD family secretion protein|nr:efflux RND transporter periplasmic adaptor subunit [Candidatus Neomarinimicrobiota bacterium]MDD3966249.1 efflux RND transporter periplasmic adaptor subunit [Candidatus Neomarinimicrobiota bacterium]MDX9780322.1 efflux RND transporter periplasmic adaptor subunit [bacterium]
MKKKKIIIILAAVLLLGVFIAFTLKQDNKKAIAVQMEKVALRTIESKVYAAGYVQPVIKVNISANVSGEIIALNVREGQEVKKGQVLAQLDQVMYQAEVEQAKSYHRSCLSARDVAEKDFYRVEELFRSGNYSESQYDQTKAQYEQAVATLEQAAARLKQSEDNLRKTTLVAPIDGTVIGLKKEQGEIAMGSTFQADVVMTVADLSGMEVEVDVNENDIVRVELGDSVDIEIDALGKKRFSGYVTEISQLATTVGAGTQNAVTNFKVLVKMTEIPAEIRSGMNATVEILTERKEQVLAVPIRAVTVRPEDKVRKTANGRNEKPMLLEVVFAVEADTVRAVPVELGISSEDYFEVLSGVDTSYTIVTGNHQALTFDLQSGTAVKDVAKVKQKGKTPKS